MITLEAVAIEMGWDSPARVARHYQYNWWFTIKAGIRKSSTSYKDRAVTGWWFNPWFMVYVLGFWWGIGFAVSQPAPQEEKGK